MPSVKGDGMRGLAVFISDIRNCKSKEAELKRINEELVDIRSKFKGNSSFSYRMFLYCHMRNSLSSTDKTLDCYQKKKYVCKLLFIFLLGNDIDFGHMEAINLLSSSKYTEKQICISDIESREVYEAFCTDLPKVLVSGETIDFVKHSAVLCILKLFRNSPESFQLGEYASSIVHLLNDSDISAVTSVAYLIEALSKKWPEEYKGAVPLAIHRLSRIVTATYTDLQDYTYHFVPAQWLCVRFLRLLQNYPPPDDSSDKARLFECLEAILNKAQDAPKSEKVQHSEAKNAVFFEAIALVIHMDSEPQLLVRACNQLGTFLSHRETRLRYLALESMRLLATSEFSHDAVKKHQETIINSLKTERDVSVRQKAVDLLYALCDSSNANQIVANMLTYLKNADNSVKEEMVLKVAILAEKYATDYTWYVDVILELIQFAGDYVSEEIWYRVIQIVVNHEDVQGYAAETVFKALQNPTCHEIMVKVGGYILGEFGNLIAVYKGYTAQIQYKLLSCWLDLSSITTRRLLHPSFIKIRKRADESRESKSQMEDKMASGLSEQFSLCTMSSNETWTPPKTLFDMPVDVVGLIIERSDYKEQLILLSCWDDCILCDYNDQCIAYALPTWDHVDFLSTYLDYRLDTVVSKFNYEQVAFDDLALTLNNPKLQLETFEFDSYCDDDCCYPFKYKDKGGKINNKYGNMESTLKSNNHQLSVKACTIELLSFRSDNPILSHLKPGVLERIIIRSAHDKEWSAYSEAMDKVALLEQWKQAKELEAYYGLDEDFPVKYATHFKRLHFEDGSLYPESLVLIRDLILENENIEFCSILVEEEITADYIAADFADIVGILVSPNLYHYTIPNSKGYLEFLIKDNLLTIEKKKKKSI
ncbi:unnamed protein product [Caenorhabditis brenneri]